MAKTFIDTLEEVTEEVAQWASQTINQVTEIISPDGRPYMSRLLSEEEQVEQYLNLRGDPQAWSQWLGERELEIIQELLQGGMNEAEISLVSPQQLAASIALQYSASMEKLINRRLSQPIEDEKYTQDKPTTIGPSSQY